MHIHGAPCRAFTIDTQRRGEGQCFFSSKQDVPSHDHA